MALVGFAICVCLALALGLSAAQADQLPPLPPPPSAGDGGSSDNGSPDGYPDATENQAESLFTTNFSDTVDSLAQDPPDLGGKDPRFLNDRTALIASNGASPADLNDQIQQILDQDQGDIEAARSDLNDLIDQQSSGTPQLVSSTQPLRAPTDNGQTAPVDLSLDSQGSGYVPDNPLVDLKLPDNASNDVSVGDQGITVDVGATQSASADAISGGDNLFYHEAATDTDVVLAPLSVGFETLYQLRSPQSPEHFEIGFSLPAGASLQDSDGGGAAIVKDGDTLGTVSAPSAQDAAGNPVPVTTSVDGDSLELSIPHRDADVAYPINVDPVTDVYTGSGGGIGAFSTDWTHGQNSGGAYEVSTTCVQNVSCTSGTTGPRGLYINAPTNHTYNAGQAATWLYTVPHWPSTAYISALTLGPISYHRHSGTSTNPYLAAGILSGTNLSWVTSMTQQTDMDNTYWIMGPPNQQVAPTAQIAVFQLYAGASQSLTHWRDAFLGGAQVGLSDTDNPTVNVNTAPLTSGWIDGKQATSFQVPVADGGLGVSGVYAPGANGYGWTTFPNQSNPSAGACVGTHASPCPQSGSVTAGFYPGVFAEGQSQTLVIALDALGKVAVPVWNIRVDKTPPQISTSGGLSQGGGTDPYKLHVAATDGSTSDPANWRSGVRRIYVDVNGQTVADTGQHACTPTAGSCPLSLDYTPDPSSFSSNQLHFKVTAADELGHAQTRCYEVKRPEVATTEGSRPSVSAPRVAAVRRPQCRHRLHRAHCRPRQSRPDGALRADRACSWQGPGRRPGCRGGMVGVGPSLSPSSRSWGSTPARPLFAGSSDPQLPSLLRLNPRELKVENRGRFCGSLATPTGEAKIESLTVPMAPR